VDKWWRIFLWTNGGEYLYDQITRRKYCGILRGKFIWKFLHGIKIKKIQSRGWL
jgi:hypothetical protein